MDGAPKAGLVTGAGKRIGRAIALALAAEGWAVAVHCNDSEREAREVAGEIERGGGKAVVLRADLRDERETLRLVDRAAEALGPLGCLVNNASLFEPDDVGSATRASWDAHMDVNLRAPFVLSQGFAQKLPAAAPPGGACIVNVIDQRVLNLRPDFVSYTVSKSALWTLTRTLAMALAPRVRVNGVGPGPTLPSRHQTEEQFARLSRRMPLQRGATPEEIAAAVIFFLGARAVTGQMLAVDGGEHLGWDQPRGDGEG